MGRRIGLLNVRNRMHEIDSNYSWRLYTIVHLKLSIQKTKIMTSGPITSWKIDRATVQTVRDFIFLGSKITAEVTAAMKLKDTCSFEEMTTHSSILAWEIPWTEVSGRLQSMGSHELDTT